MLPTRRSRHCLAGLAARRPACLRQKQSSSQSLKLKPAWVYYEDCPPANSYHPRNLPGLRGISGLWSSNRTPPTVRARKLKLAALKGGEANKNRAHRRHVLARYVEHGSGGMRWLGSVARASQRRLLHVGRRQRTDEIRRGRWSPGLLQRARGPPACGAVCRAASSAAGRDGAANGGG